MRKVINQNRIVKLEVAVGASCFVGGILAALLGSVLTAGEWLVGSGLHPGLHVAGTALLIAAIPLILFAGFCLDWAEHRPNQASGNDRDPGQGKGAAEPTVILKEINRVVEKAGAARHEEISLFAYESGDRTARLQKANNEASQRGSN